MVQSHVAVAPLPPSLLMKAASASSNAKSIQHDWTDKAKNGGELGNHRPEKPQGTITQKWRDMWVRTMNSGIVCLQSLWLKSAHWVSPREFRHWRNRWDCLNTRDPACVVSCPSCRQLHVSAHAHACTVCKVSCYWCTAACTHQHRLGDMHKSYPYSPQIFVDVWRL